MPQRRDALPAVVGPHHRAQLDEQTVGLALIVLQRNRLRQNLRQDAYAVEVDVGQHHAVSQEAAREALLALARQNDLVVCSKRTGKKDERERKMRERDE